MLFTWIDRGEVNRRTANQFYSMIQSANSHVRRLMNEKAQHEEELEQAKENFKNALLAILTQCKAPHSLHTLPSDLLPLLPRQQLRSVNSVSVFNRPVVWLFSTCDRHPQTSIILTSPDKQKTYLYIMNIPIHITPHRTCCSDCNGTSPVCKRSKLQGKYSATGISMTTYRIGSAQGRPPYDDHFCKPFFLYYVFVLVSCERNWMPVSAKLFYVMIHFDSQTPLIF